mmetsp:Transcript_70946/g.229693  ORF Transcript_70946/g.229693 Transcript_70946/m.229693 type:complete len:222 (-) Transcript_70946:493-1158(-)
MAPALQQLSLHFLQVKTGGRRARVERAQLLLLDLQRPPEKIAPAFQVAQLALDVRQALQRPDEVDAVEAHVFFLDPQEPLQTLPPRDEPANLALHLCENCKTPTHVRALLAMLLLRCLHKPLELLHVSEVLAGKIRFDGPQDIKDLNVPVHVPPSQCTVCSAACDQHVQEAGNCVVLGRLLVALAGSQTSQSTGHHIQQPPTLGLALEQIPGLPQDRCVLL